MAKQVLNQGNAATFRGALNSNFDELYDDKTVVNTAAGHTTANVVLRDGQFGLETDTRKRKIGNGVTAWNALAYEPGNDASRPTVILFLGESNAQGIPANTFAQAWELLARSELKILDPTALVFQNLDIGTNNGAASLTQHGWELQLANAMRLGDLPGIVYVVKAAISGTRISEWSVGNVSGYWANSFLARVAAAETALSTNVNWIVWNSSSINEQRDGMSATNYKSAQLSYFARIRARLGPTTPILILKTPTTFVEYNAAYATAVDQMVAEDSRNYAISSTGLPVSADTYHWDYQGVKEGAERLISQTQTLMAVATHAKKHVTYTSLTNAINDGLSIESTGATPSGGTAARMISHELPWSVIAEFDGDSAGTTLVAFDFDQTIDYVWNNRMFVAGFVWNGGIAYFANASSLVNAATGFTFPGKVKFEKSGNNITVSSTADGGLTWTIRHTITPIATYLSLWVKVVFQGPVAGERIRVSVYQ